MKRPGLYILPLSLIGVLIFVVWLFWPKPQPPNIILISIDTLRADHLGCYGYEKNSSPHLDTLATQSFLFENHFAPSSLTKPSHVSMLTSLYPLTHSVLTNHETLSFSEEIVPIAKILKDNGFRTGAFTGGGSVSQIDGFDRGFDIWSEGHLVSGHLPVVKDWLENNREEKFFLFFHFYDVHAPYIFRENYKDMYHDLEGYVDLISLTEKILSADRLTLEYFHSLTLQEKFSLLVTGLLQKLKRRPEEGVGAAARKEMFAMVHKWRQIPEYTKHIELLVDSYDAGIKYTDHYMGELFAFLKSLGLWENTLLVVTSDHGEEFMEHNMVTHGGHLYDTLIHIPLIIKMPSSFGKTAKRITGLSDIVDLMPTILDVLNINFKGQMQGQSLLPSMQGKQRHSKDRIYASLDIGKSQKMRIVRTDRWKYIIGDMDFSEKDEIYDLREDRFEKRNLITESGEALPQLKIYLTDHIRECLGLFQSKYSKGRKNADDYPEELQKDRLEILRALGYIH
jgi:arylsulfatase A-like enzyme